MKTEEEEIIVFLPPSSSAPRPLPLPLSRSASDGKVIPAINFPLSPPKSPTIVGNINGRPDRRTEGEQTDRGRTDPSKRASWTQWTDRPPNEGERMILPHRRRHVEMPK